MSWTMHCCSDTSQLYPLYVGANVFLKVHAPVVSDELTDDAHNEVWVDGIQDQDTCATVGDKGISRSATFESFVVMPSVALAPPAATGSWQKSSDNSSVKSSFLDRQFIFLQSVTPLLLLQLTLTPQQKWVESSARSESPGVSSSPTPTTTRTPLG